MKISNLIFGCILVMLALLLSCSDNGVQPAPRTSTFPLTSGSNWHYRYAEHFVPIRHPSDSTVNAYDIFRRVAGPSRLNDSVEAITVIDSVWREPGTYYNKIYWWGISNSKLLQYASSSSSNGIYYDTIIYNTPNVILDFPLEIGKSWVDRRFYRCYRRVIGTSIIEVGDRAFDCDIVEGAPHSEIPEIDDSTIIREYYTDQGMIFSTTDNGYIVSLDSMGNLSDSAHSISYVSLLDYQINK